jgi:metal-dependent amidase/aminoacylase/carboxypeptidase family protein
MRVKSGALMAHVAEFKITVVGKGGHGSQPQTCVDPIVCGAAIITALQTIVSRSLHYKDSAVVSVNTSTAGDARNSHQSQKRCALTY